MSFQDTLDRHHNCQVVIIPRFHKGRPKLVHGLYCTGHAKLIKWLTRDQSQELKTSGVELLDPINSDRMALIRQQLTFKENSQS